MVLATLAPAAGQSLLTGEVSHVRDGDTIELGGVAIRLGGLHAPEMDEPGGPVARDFMRRLVEGHTLACELDGERSHDRLIGICFLPDGSDIAAHLVASGLGRDCPRHSGGRYRADETAASRLLPLPGYCRP